MKRKAVAGIMQIPLLIGLLILACNIESLGEEPSAISKAADAQTTQSPSTSDVETTQNGPRRDLTHYYYAEGTALYSDLKAGEIDVMYETLTPAQYQDAILDPNIILAPVERMDVRAWSLNNNETIATYPGVRSAMSYVDFRRAIWRLSNKPYYTEVICGGFATELPVPIAASSSNWWNTSVVNYVNTNLYFSIQGAATLLDTAGFNQGTESNPYYNPGVPGSAQYWRTYPASHPQKPGQKLDPVVFSARSDDTLRLSASAHLRDMMLESGIPVTFISEGSGSATMRVTTQRNYHIYSAAWSVSKFPTYLYGWFYSGNWFPGGSNYHVSPTSPPYPSMPTEIDAKVAKILYTSSYQEAMTAAKDSQYLLIEKYTNMIPLWSTKSFYAYRNLLGACNMRGTGPENVYTLLNAFRADNPSGPIRVGQLPPSQLNQIYSSSTYDLSTMNPVMASFMSMAPYDIMTDQPWLSQDWASDTWVDPDDGQVKSKLTLWFRDDAEWIKPVTGQVLADFDTQWLLGEGPSRSGYEFNCWYYDSVPTGNIYGNYKDIKLIRTYSGERKAEIYFDVQSYWSQYWATGRILYASEDPAFPGWKQSPLATVVTKVFVEGINVTTPGFLSLPIRTTGTPVEVIEIKEEGVALTPIVDYEIVGSTTNGPRIKIYEDVDDGKVLMVKYWARGDPAGYTPGGLGWQKTLVGTGAFYMADFLSGSGGWGTYEANSDFLLETPPKGEIDFKWYWYSRAQPRDGYYHVNDLDVEMVTDALGSSGTGVPSWNWEPGCDLALPLGQIDVSDLLVVTSAVCTPWGSPTPNPPPPPTLFHDIAVIDIDVSKAIVVRGNPVSINVTIENQGYSTETFDVILEANESPIHTETISDLDSGQDITFTFVWDTTDFPSGNYEISAYATPIYCEDDVADNLYIDGTILIIEPAVSVYPVIVGPPPKISETFNVNITINDVKDLYTWQAGLAFNASVLEAISIAEGEFLKSSGFPTLWTPGSMDNTNGTIHYSACSITGPNPGVNGSGQLMSVTFMVKNSGYSLLQLTDVILLDSDLMAIEPVNILDGGVTIHEQDIAILSATTSATEAYPTWIVPLNVTVVVENRGTRTETFHVAVLANTTIIENKSVTLPAGTNITLIFNWNLAGVAEGNYTIRVEATVLYGELKTGDNTITDGKVRIKHPGDADGNGILNAYDLGILAKAWGTQRGDPLFALHPDFNGDGKIDASDHKILVDYWP